jgi:hypothetical protein
MLKKHLIALGITVSMMLLIISTFFYPGGSEIDKNSVGYDWANNYLCNLFNEKAVNGMNNPTRYPAIVGMFFLCLSSALFFIRFSKKIPTKTAANIIQYSGCGSMFCAFLVVTPYHDVMTTIASVLALITLFYMTIFTFKTKLTFLKYLSLVSIIIIYLNNYIYYTHNFLSWLAILQKTSFLTIIIWLLGLEYFATKEDFAKNS